MYVQNLPADNFNAFKVKEIGFSFCPFCRERHELQEIRNNRNSGLFEIGCKCGAIGKAKSYYPDRMIVWEKKVSNTYEKY